MQCVVVPLDIRSEQPHLWSIKHANMHLLNSKVDVLIIFNQLKSNFMKFQKLPRHNFNISISPPVGDSGFNCTTLLEMKSYLADKGHDERDFDKYI